jgi:hypothetical protein
MLFGKKLASINYSQPWLEVSITGPHSTLFLRPLNDTLTPGPAYDMASPAAPGLFFCFVATVLLIFVCVAAALARYYFSTAYFPGICICANMGQCVFPPCVQWRP